MKNFFLLLFVLVLFTSMFAPSAQADIGVTVTNPTNTTPNLAATYTSLALALTDLNAVTAMTGPVILTLDAGSSETAPATGFTIGSATLNPVLSSTNTVTIIKAGGVVTLNAGIGTATPASAAPDGILKIVGANYITIDGLTFTDGNSTNPTTMEFGVALFKLSLNDGAQNNTIQNCTFNMQRINNANSSGPMVEGSVGILVINSTPAAATTALTPTLAAGSNSYNKFYGNTLNGGNYGIALSGFAALTPFNLGDTGNEVGGPSMGNTILNFGGAAAATNPSAGIRANYQWGINISYNVVNNNNGSGVNHPNTLRGIFAQQGTSANVTISFNIITVNGGGTTTLVEGINNGIGATAASNTVTIFRNTIENCTYATATTGEFKGIYNNGSAATVTINGNTVKNNTQSGTGAFTGIDAGTSTNLNLFDNNVFGNTKTSPGTTAGSMFCMRASTSMISLHDNAIYSNTFNTTGGTTAATLYGYYNGGSPTVETYYSNQIYDLNVTGATTSTSCVLYGLYTSTTSTDVKNWSLNDIHDLSITSTSTGGGTVYGISSSLGATINIFRNKVCNLSAAGASGATHGIYIGSGTTVNVYNNLVGNLYKPAVNAVNAVNGIYISGGTTSNIYYNTVYLNATSTGALFSSNAVYASTTPTVTLRNNILVNTSTPTGAGVTAAYRRSSTSMTTYGSASNNNFFYAGTPSATMAIFTDGTNTDPTLAAFQARVTPRDAASLTDISVPSFKSTTCGDPDFLHMNTTSSVIESGGAAIAGFDNDYDNNIRSGSAGYPAQLNGGGSAPDIGADEYDGIPNYTCASPDPRATIASTNNLCLGQSVTLSLEAATPGTGVTYQWQSSPDGGTYTNIVGANSSTYTTTPTAPIYFQCIVTCQNGPSSATSDPVAITFQNSILSTTPGSRCGTGTVQLAATGSAGTINWYAAASGGAAIGTGSPFTTPVISATTNYYASALVSGGITTVGPASPTAQGGTIATQTVAWNVNFTTFSPTEIKSVDIFPIASGQAGVIQVRAGSSTSGTLLATVNYTTSVSGGSTPQTIDINYALPVPGSYNLYTSTLPSSGITRNTSGAVYPYTSTVANITGNGYDQTYFMGMYNWKFGSECASPRTQVTATVTPAPVLTITANQTVCSNEVATLSVSSNIPDYESYVWSPATNLFTDFACSLPYDGVSSATTLYVKSADAVVTAYTCAATNTASGCANAALSTVTVLSPNPLVSATPESVCSSGTAVITLSPATGWGAATFQWQDSPDNATFTNIAAATSQNYTTPVLTSTTYYKLVIKNGSGSVCVSPQATIIVTNPLVTGTTPATRCGTGTVNLLATVSGGTLKWYAALTGGSPIGTGSPFTTPVITATTSYFAGCDAYAPNSAAVGAGVSTSATYSNPFYSAYSNNHTQHLITAAELTAAGIGQGNLRSVALYVTSAGTLPMIDLSVKIASTTATSMTAFLAPTFSVVYSSASYMPFVGLNVLTFSSPFYWDGVSNIVLEFCHGNRDAAVSMTRTVRSDATAYVATIKTHATIATEASVICGDVTSNLLTYSTRPQFTFQGEVACSSPRTEVIATVTPPPTLTITTGQAICTNEIFQIGVTSTVTDFNVYTWSPVTNLFSDADCLVPYVALAHANPVYVKSGTGGITAYTCSGTNTGTGCSNTAVSTVTVIPVPVIASTPPSICISGSATLSLTPATGYGNATFQWQDSPDNVTFTDIAAATSSSYVTSTISTTTYYKVVIKNSSGAVCSESVYELFVNNPQITGTTGGTRCGIGSVQLSATASPGATINWYTASSGGTLVGSGSPFSTPSISTTTSFFAAASSGGQSGITIPGDGGWNHATTAGEYQTSIITGSSMTLTVLQPLTLSSMDIYPSATLGTAFSIEARTGSSSGATFASYAGTTTVVNSGTPTVAQTVPVNWTLPAGTYYIGFVGTNPNTWRSGTFTHTLPWTLAGVASMNFSLTPSYQYYFYNLNLSTGCESGRTEAIATVTPADPISPTATSPVCAGSACNLNVTSSNPNYTYVWAPGNLTGASQTVYPEAPTTYSVTATDAIGGCVNVGSASVTITATPSPITITPSAPVIAPGATQQLVASGGNMTPSVTIGTGTTTNATTGYPSPYSNYYGGSKHQMLIRASELTTAGLVAGAQITSISFTVTAVGSTFTGNLNNFQIDMGHTTETVLTSTAFIGGLTNVLAPGTVAIAVGTKTHTLGTAFTWDGTSNLVVQTSYSNENTGTATDYVLMTNSDPGFVSTNWWRADGVTAAAILAYATPYGSGNARPNMLLGYASAGIFAWTPITALYTDAGATLPYAGENLTTVYTKPASTITYTATSTSTLTGCSRSKQVIVTIGSPMTLEGAAVDASCYGVADGSVSTSLTGGIAPIGYLWSNGATTTSLTNVLAGTYSVTVTDATSSFVTGTWTVNQPTQILPTAVVTDASCPTTNNGSIDLSVTGGSPGYTFLWSNSSVSEDLGELAPGVYTVTVTDASNCTATASWTVGVLDPVCNYQYVTGTVTGTVCYDAHITIIVANSSAFTVAAPLGHATFIASQNILFKQGTTVQSGAYMHGYISNIFCSPADLPAVAAAVEEEQPASLSLTSFTLYPNPTNGNFTLVQKGEQAYGSVKVEVFNMNGSKVMTSQMIGEKQHEFATASLPAGIYFVKIVAEGQVETIKLIKTR